MPSWKYLKISKKQDEVLGGLPMVLGLNILNLMRQGYFRFELEDLGDVILLKAMRRKKEWEYGKRKGG